MSSAEKKSNEANWAIARARWEGEPNCSFGDLIPLLGLTKQGIGKRARKDKWQKKLNMATIVEKAHAEADKKFAKEAAKRSKEGIPVDALPPQTDEAPETAAGTADQLEAAVESAAVDARSNVIARHRTEWKAARNILYQSIRSKDGELAKKVKANIESMQRLQEGERKAWGLDAGEEKPVVIIERK